jgi:DNA-binding MarR family transcriptional regulator
MSEPLGVSTLLSQCLVAFTIEFDNEFEHRMPHRTTRGAGTGVWLVSQVMWSNVMRHLDPNGCSVAELQRRARTTMLSLTGLQRWRYVTVEPGPAGLRGQQAELARVVRPTASGRRAKSVWRPLAAEVEGRWSDRHGADVVGRLRAALGAVVAQLDVATPDYLPVVHYALFTRDPVRSPWLMGNPAGHRSSDLSALMSYVLATFTAEFEERSLVSLPVAANALRVLDRSGTKLRDLPGLAGVSKEAISMSLGPLESAGLVVREADPGASRGKVARLTPAGLAAQRRAARLAAQVEQEWYERFGSGVMDELRRALEAVAHGPSGGGRSPLFDGLEPYPDGWRASVRSPEILPFHPTVLHRGGWPDGS